MRSLIQFIGKYSNFLVFLVLEVVAFLLIITNNTYPRSRVWSSANAFVATQTQWQHEVEDYFRLHTINEQLMTENAQLRDSLMRLANQLEGVEEQSYRYAHLQMHYIPARVIHSTRNYGHNFLTINKGSGDSIQVGQGVRNAQGVVGIICTVSEHFALVMPVVNTNSRISCRLSKNAYPATLVWQGLNWHSAQLNDVAAHVDIQVGDSVVTSGLTSSFPAGIPVGVVSEVKKQEGDSYYTIALQLTTDFKCVDAVQVIDNDMAAEQNSLDNGLD